MRVFMGYVCVCKVCYAGDEGMVDFCRKCGEKANVPGTTIEAHDVPITDGFRLVLSAVLTALLCCMLRMIAKVSWRHSKPRGNNH